MLLDVFLPARLIHLLSLILLLAFFPPPALICHPHLSEPCQQLLTCTGHLRMVFVVLGMVWWSLPMSISHCHEEAADIPPPLSTAAIHQQNCKFPTRAMAQARAGPKPAVICGFGPAWIFCRPEPSEARPKLRLLGQAGPEHH
ncbi:uncharacterized protein F5147DRAFT_798845 [Suillus discolor]|uniref:Secreted protein n=1 Tax=Suillus discolor TaxID=1912936 RepID=A0A9P7F8L8_9AGAM|nr:uncharacterized protein F5147DRAFT_798845 [Suillus discolor]KAG2108894.1 hypothetical protein F5147DRAFT_798845 [Suillus discolor]